MRKRISIGLGCLLSACTLLTGARSAAAGEKAIATVDDLFDFGALGAKGGTAVSAYSKQNAVVNNSITTTVNNGGAAQTVGNAAPLPFFGTGGTAPAIAGLSPAFGIFGRYASGSSYQLFKQNLTKINDQYTIDSTTGNYDSEGSAFINAAGNRSLFAFAVGGAAKGNAAGRATDPYAVPSGTTYAYDPTITGSIMVDEVGGTASINALATDTSITSLGILNSYDDNGPQGSANLWTLSLNASTPTISPTSVAVNFQLNPAALNEINFDPAFLATLGSFANPTAEAALISTADDALIAGQLTPNAGELDLNTLNVFPPNTTFTPISGGVTYENEVDGEVAGVPEPTGASLLLIGGLGLLARRRRGNRRKPTSN